MPAHPVASSAGGVTWSGPGWRIPADARGAVDALRREVAPGAPVLLPLDIAPWTTGFEQAPTPLVVRADYLGVLRERLGGDEIARRMQLARIVSGEVTSARAAEAIRRAIDDYDLAAVGLAGTALVDDALAAALREAGFERVWLDGDHALWARPAHSK